MQTLVRNTKAKTSYLLAGGRIDYRFVLGADVVQLTIYHPSTGERKDTARVAIVSAPIGSTTPAPYPAMSRTDAAHLLRKARRYGSSIYRVL